MDTMATAETSDDSEDDHRSDELRLETMKLTALIRVKLRGRNSYKVAAALKLLEAAVLEAKLPLVSSLITQQHDTRTLTQFTTTLKTVIQRWGWKPKYASAVLTRTREILGLLGMTAENVARIRMRWVKAKLKSEPIPGRYLKLAPDSKTRQTLRLWITSIRRYSKLKAPQAIRACLFFFTSVYEQHLGLSLEDWDTAKPEETFALFTPEKIVSICGTKQSATKNLRWLQLFLKGILRIQRDQVIPDEVQQLIQLKMVTLKRLQEEKDEGHDGHRISSAALDRLYEASLSDPFDELFFLLLITTGMRVGGLVHIKIRAVAQQTKKAQWVAKEIGTTREKGHKKLTFPITKRVRALIQEWLTKLRPFHTSPYLFPGRADRHLSSRAINARFGKLCQRAGVQGPEFHPHALRHSFAHMILEAGNSVEVVSKLLNHSSPAVTQQFYLKESIQEVTARASIPWFSAEDNETQAEPEPLPKFLQSTTTSNKKKRQRETAVQQQRQELAGLAALNYD